MLVEIYISMWVKNIVHNLKLIRDAKISWRFGCIMYTEMNHDSWLISIPGSILPRHHNTFSSMMQHQIICVVLLPG